jgi:hypothetical protein
MREVHYCYERDADRRRIFSGYGRCARCDGELLRVILVTMPDCELYLEPVCGQCASPEELADATRTRDCPGCGIPMSFNHRDEYSTRWVACSRRCYQRAWRASRRTIQTLTCEVCREPFQSPRSDARYCSNACRQWAYRLRRASLTAPATPP